ncbi:UNVERIFIED_CONTAM: putative F420-dependent oxidoreductase [Williamsia faeni]
MSALSNGSLKIDGGIPADLATVPEVAARLERQGFDGCWSGEVAHDPFFPLVLAAEHTSRLELGTSIAVAFARNPMTVANLGWDLQDYSQGRFTLGLGTQIQPHIEKRFGMPWSHPVRRMQEFIAALEAIWEAWHEQRELRFEGEFYTHKLMTPMFRPEPSVHPAPKVFVAAVGERMTEMCGESADGIIGHAFTTRLYYDEVTSPAIARGLQRSGRDRSDFQVTSPVFLVTGENPAETAAASEAVRRQIAFYGSTPAYGKVLELHGWGDLHTRLHRLSREGEWAQMGSLIDDEVLDAFAVVAPPDGVAAGLWDRCGGSIDRAMPMFPKTISAETVSAVLDDLHAR